MQVLNYTPPFFLLNAHFETIYPALFRKVNLKPFLRERITTPDDDFLDLDWLKQGSKKLVVISHGLEGSTSRPYIRGMAKACLKAGYDVLTWNYRGCSEDMNQQLRFYHSGATDDLDTVVCHALNTSQYDEVNLIGFSLGGNLTLKYTGENNYPSQLKKVIAFSVPMDLHGSCLKISQPENWVYANRFIKSLKKKIIRKSRSMKGLDTKGIENISSLLQFDNQYTAPLHGYADALEYYQKCSSLGFVNQINIPTLIINAKNDPFLSEHCHPHKLLKNHPHVKLISTDFGGHVGFCQFNKQGTYWSEDQAIAFLSTNL